MCDQTLSVEMKSLLCTWKWSLVLRETKRVRHAQLCTAVRWLLLRLTRIGPDGGMSSPGNAHAQNSSEPRGTYASVRVFA
jgi:hypothetical protein